MLASTGLRFDAGGKRLVDEVALEVRPGRIVAIAGPNGAGKSTLLRLLAGELAPRSGSITLDGVELNTFSPAELARRRAVVPQATALQFPFTALEVVLLGATVPAFGGADARSQTAARAAIDSVGLSGFEDRLYGELSGGERQRVHIARALCQLAVARRHAEETSVLLLDEPTASLDLGHQGLVLSELRRQAGLGRAVLVILHDLNLAVDYADAIVMMNEGRVIASGAPGLVLDARLLSEIYGCAITTAPAPDNRAYIRIMRPGEHGASAR